MELQKNTVIGVIGAGTMGLGIAQVAAFSGHAVFIYDSNSTVLQQGADRLKASINRLVEKQKITGDQGSAIFNRVTWIDTLNGFSGSSLIIEAVIENLEVKQQLFSALEKIVSDTCILATNTSSLSITAIASACFRPQRVIGIHFFNPAPVLPLVEIVKGVATGDTVEQTSRTLINSWGKSTVLARDTPGFIVNRVARPFYGESIRIYEEQIADIPTIDWALKEVGGFKMGPFELMDLIGNDINYTVTESVWTQLFYDARYQPSLTQKRLVEARRFGKKSGIGYYDYSKGTVPAEPEKDRALGEKIVNRVVAMLINEAVDARYLNIATRDDLDLAMTKGVNYPRGLLEWCDEIGAGKILHELNVLSDTYGDNRYRPSPLLKSMVKENKKFY